MKNTFFCKCTFKEEEGNYVLWEKILQLSSFHDVVKKGRFYREVKRNCTNHQGLYYETGRRWHPTALHINLCSPTKCPSCFYLPFQTLISSCFSSSLFYSCLLELHILLQLKFLVSIREFIFSIL